MTKFSNIYEAICKFVSRVKVSTEDLTKSSNFSELFLTKKFDLP